MTHIRTVRGDLINMSMVCGYTVVDMSDGRAFVAILLDGGRQVVMSEHNNRGEAISVIDQISSIITLNGKLMDRWRVIELSAGGEKLVFSK